MLFFIMGRSTSSWVVFQMASEPVCKTVEIHAISASTAEGKALDALEVRESR